MIKQRQLNYLEMKEKYPKLLYENKILKTQYNYLKNSNETLKKENQQLKLLLLAKIERFNNDKN